MMLERFLNILAPAHCSYCRALLEMRTVFCERCTKLVRPLFATDIKLTQARRMPVYAMGAYEEPLASLIRAKHGRYDTAAYQLGELVAEYSNRLSIPIDYLIPVPLHWRRFFWRGFNQAALMAQVIGKRNNNQVADILRRVRHTAYQTTCDGADRSSNVTDAFALQSIDYTLYREKHLILVDDVMTTGSTLYEAGRALLPLKPASIAALVAGRTVF